MNHWYHWLYLSLSVGFFVQNVPSVIADSVSVITLDGRTIEGRLVDAVDSSLSVVTSSGTETFAFNLLDRVEMKSNEGGETPALATEFEIAKLVDGSEVVCRAFSGRDDRWTAKTLAGKELEFPKACVESLLLRVPSPALRLEWTQAVSEKRTGDEIVILRPGDSVDRAAGMIVAVNDDQIDFSFDGQILQAPRAKLLGLLWYRAQERRVEPAVQVNLKDGSRWEATRLELDRNSDGTMSGLKWGTPCGVEASATWGEIREINFSVANVVWLANQSPLAKKTFQRPIVKGSYAGRDDLLGPRFSSTDGSEDPKSQDLHFLGPGELSFRVPEGFQKFVAKIRRSEQAKFATAVRCQVWIGDALAWDKMIDHDQMEAVVEIAVTPEKQLRLVVDCESDLMLGTQLSWQQPRLTR